MTTDRRDSRRSPRRASTSIARGSRPTSPPCRRARPAAGVRLRPHAKTHKSPGDRADGRSTPAPSASAARSSARRKCSPTRASRTSGCPTRPIRRTRTASWRFRIAIRLSIVVDDLEVARQWSDAMTRAGPARLDVLVKVDVGFHRCGVNPDAPGDARRRSRDRGAAGPAFPRACSATPATSYHAESADELDAIAGAGDRDPFDELARRPSRRRRRRAGDQRRRRRRPRASSRRRRASPKCGRATTSSSIARRSGSGAADARPMLAQHRLDRRQPARPRARGLRRRIKTLSNGWLRGFGHTVGHGFVYASLDARTPGPVHRDRAALRGTRGREGHADCRLKPG